jgi:malate:Na+ symporter
MVAYKLIPLPAVKTVTSFMKTTNFLYVFIALIVVGSIISMNRKVLIKAFLKMFIPLTLGSLAATGVGVGVGTLLGIGLYKSFFFIVVPIMAGGVGEGALPLSMGYSSILNTAQDELFAQVLPVVMLGSLTAIILAGLLKRLGEIRPEYSGNGSLLKTGDGDVLKHTNKNEERSFDLSQMVVGATLALGLYMLGVYLNYLIGLPAPIVMLFAAVLIKVCNLLPKKIEDGSYAIYRFTVIGITYPLLLGVGVAMTPWKSLVAVITNPSYLITIFFTVLTMVVVAFFVGKWMNMNPIETAIVTACHSGQGGTGDIAILTASDRLVLMPFAQVSTRIGGAATVTLAIIFLKWVIG